MHDKKFTQDLKSSGRIGNTPLQSIALLIKSRWHKISLKLESHNPAGSSKDRTAQALIADLECRSLLTASSIIIESTSGNLGASLAYVCGMRGFQFLAVIDPKTTPALRNRMQEYGARLEMVQEKDENGGYLFSRLKRVRELCAQCPDYVWADQYSNPANPEAHYRHTAPEIFSQTRGKVDAVFVAVSTGGTFAGIDRFFREVRPATRTIPVDAIGSVVFGGPPGLRMLTGIGSSRQSSFFQPGHNHHPRMVADRDAFAVCRLLVRRLGLSLGGSSGAVIAACAQALAEDLELQHVVCLCADGGKNYDSTIYSDAWLKTNHFDPDYEMPLIEDVAAFDECAATVFLPQEITGRR
ncbi:MAG: cysteine synthase family protein [Acidobacteriia bacterium]|nr:cysteine synthase family protein [Terriglobia bacterium]